MSEVFENLRERESRIKAIETRIISIPFEMGGPRHVFAGQPWRRMETLLVKVETDDGFVGWGEAFGHAAISITKSALDDVIAPLAVGEYAADINRLATKMLHSTHLLGRNSPFVYAVAGIETALWDILGKVSGQPLWRLLGGRAPAQMQAYSSLLNYPSDDFVARNVAAAREAGYQYIKLHQTTVDSVLSAREAAPDAFIMLDVNCAWTPAEAAAMCINLKPHDLYWLEEPIWPPEDVHALARLRRYDLPIAAGENVAGLFGFKTLIDAGAVDIAQPSLTKLGGVGEMVRIIHLCQANGVRVVPHSPYFGPGLVATTHIAAAMLDNSLIEVLWVEMEESPFDPWIRPVNGMMRVPDGPGLGCDPDPELLVSRTRGEVVRIGMERKAT